MVELSAWARRQAGNSTALATSDEGAKSQVASLSGDNVPQGSDTFVKSGIFVSIAAHPDSWLEMPHGSWLEMPHGSWLEMPHGKVCRKFPKWKGACVSRLLRAYVLR